MTRRKMVRTVFAGVGAAFALPGLALGHPILKHLNDASLLEQTESQANTSDWKPTFFTPQQNELLVALAERILPGSSQAQVNRTVDLVLSVETSANRDAVARALTFVQAE